jgi:hypothetical protein
MCNVYIYIFEGVHIDVPYRCVTHRHRHRHRHTQTHTHTHAYTQALTCLGCSNFEIFEILVLRSRVLLISAALSVAKFDRIPAK